MRGDKGDESRPAPCQGAWSRLDDGFKPVAGSDVSAVYEVGPGHWAAPLGFDFQ